MKARKARLAAGVAALALAAAACGGDTGDGDGADVATQATSAPTTAAAAPTTAAPTTAAPPATTAASELPTDAMELLQLAFENSAGRSVRGDMQMDMGALATVAMHFESDSSQNFSMFMSFDEMMGGGDIGIGFEVRFVDGVQYLQFVVPEELRALVGDELPEGWFVFDAETGAAMGIVCPSALPGDAPDDGACRLPNDNTNQIEFVTSAEIVGTESIDGESMTHIRYALDIASMTEGYLAEPDGADGSLPLVGDFLPDEFIYDVWIDGDGLTRRISVDLGSFMEDLLADLDPADTEGHEDEIASMLDITNVINYYDYDTDITIEAPPADEIVGDLGDLMGSDFGEASATAPGYENS
ncbi:MAG: hypothetical protein F4Z53_12350 [Acidimicrobiales bacterium]|nr:hypothetical protein [Acidimicrobiales bacterium]MYD34580.1 hypothetical protein [Acidimicrobiales bacterium]MYI10214.1 hypothetical protein [Acidimicrobiales bacterium]